VEVGCIQNAFPPPTPPASGRGARLASLLASRSGVGAAPPNARVAMIGAQRRKAERPPEPLRGKPSSADALRPALEGENKRLAGPQCSRPSPRRKPGFGLMRSEVEGKWVRDCVRTFPFRHLDQIQPTCRQRRHQAVDRAAGIRCPDEPRCRLWYRLS
jgi:hypothetical protein